jgi:hypothetical protein
MISNTTCKPEKSGHTHTYMAGEISEPEEAIQIKAVDYVG